MLKNLCSRAVALLFLCGVCFGSFVSNGQPFADSDYLVDVWTSASATNRNAVNAMTPSRKGYLWLGTANGLAQFNGRITPFAAPALNKARVTYLFEDTQTNLWVGTESNHLVRVKRDGTVQVVDPMQGKPGGRLLSACEDSNGTVWLYLANGRLCGYRQGQLGVLNAGLDPTSEFRGVIAEKNGLLWIGTDHLLMAMEPITNLNTQTLPTEQFLQIRVQGLLASDQGGHWRLANNRIEKWRDMRLELDLRDFPAGVTQVNAMCEDLEGHLVIGTEGQGIYWYADPWKPTHVLAAEGLGNTKVTSMYRDTRNHVWFGTDAGLNRLRPRPFRLIAGSQGAPVPSVCDDRHGGAWFADARGRVLHWDGSNMKHYESTPAWTNSDVLSIFVDTAGDTFVGTAGNGLFRLEGDLFRQVPGTDIGGAISVIYQDSRGEFWLGTRRGLVLREGETWRLYSISEPVSVTALADDGQGNLWLGTARNGLLRMGDGNFTFIRKSDKGLPSTEVTALWADAQHVLWVGTPEGLVRMEKDQFTRYTTREGLLSNRIGYLIEDGQGNLWIGSPDGLLRVSKNSLNAVAQGAAKSLSVRLFGESDGLPTKVCAVGSQPATCATDDGRLWLPTARGLVVVDPRKLD